LQRQLNFRRDGDVAGMAKPSATFGNYMPKQFSGVEAPVGIHTRKNWYLKIAF